MADKTSREFPSPEALKNYLRSHPGADPKKHTVKRLPTPVQNAGEVSAMRDISSNSARAHKSIQSLKSKVDRAKSPKERRALVKDMADQGSKLLAEGQKALKLVKGDKAEALKKALSEVEDAVSRGKKLSTDGDSTHATLGGSATSLARHSEALRDLLSGSSKKASDTLVCAFKVASRYLQANLGVGQTFQNEKVRIHRFRDQIRVTDLTNAGKRGKAVMEMTVLPSYAYKGDHGAWLDRMGKSFVQEYGHHSNPYRGIKSLLTDILQDYPGEIDIHERKLRGVDVEPFGEVFEWRSKSQAGEFRGKVSPHDFHVVASVEITGPRGNKFRQDRIYGPVKKRDAALFYAWVKENLSKVRKFDRIEQYQAIWSQLGVNYDSH